MNLFLHILFSFIFYVAHFPLKLNQNLLGNESRRIWILKLGQWVRVWPLYWRLHKKKTRPIIYTNNNELGSESTHQLSPLCKSKRGFLREGKQKSKPRSIYSIFKYPERYMNVSCRVWSQLSNFLIRRRLLSSSSFVLYAVDGFVSFQPHVAVLSSRLPEDSVRSISDPFGNLWICALLILKCGSRVLIVCGKIFILLRKVMICWGLVQVPVCYWNICDWR